MSRLETLDVNAGYAGVNILDGIDLGSVRQRPRYQREDQEL